MNSSITFENTIPILNVSLSAYDNDILPLYTAIGTSLYISEKSIHSFKNRIIIYSNYVEWIQFKENLSFVEKVQMIMKKISPTINNFNKLIEVLTTVIYSSQLYYKYIKKMTFIIFSGDHASPHTNIENYYYTLGLLMPKFIYWNLSSNTILPSTIFEKNLIMSGYNSSLSKIFRKTNSSGKSFHFSTPLLSLQSLFSLS